MPLQALMCDDISLAKITTKPRFDDVKCKFYQESISKAVEVKFREKDIIRVKLPHIYSADYIAVNT